MLTGELLAAGVTVPADVADIEDPVARFRALDRLRLNAGHSRLGAPWPDVLRRLGVQITKRKAQQLVRAFAALPAEISEEMDAAKIALHTRLRYLQLDRGNRQAASEIWAAVKRRDRPELLTAAVRARLTDEDVDADAAVDAAEQAHADANAARQRAVHNGRAETVASDPGDALHRRGASSQEDVGGGGDATPAEMVDDAVVADVLAGLKKLTAALRAGSELTAYDAGSLRLCAIELLRGIHQTDPENVGADAMSLWVGNGAGRQNP